MKQLDLYSVTASGRVSLGDLVAGVQFLTAEKAADGVVTLTPVRINPATAAQPVGIVDQPLPGVDQTEDTTEAPPFN